MLSTMRGKTSLFQRDGAAGGWLFGLLQLLWIASSAQAIGIHETTNQRRNLEVNSTSPSMFSPSVWPSSRPSFASSSLMAAPSDAPSSEPSFASSSPSTSPSSRRPSDHPHVLPSDLPSQIPSNIPSNLLSNASSDMPSSGPSYSSAMPSNLPSNTPSSQPSQIASSIPSLSFAPSSIPSSAPSPYPSIRPSLSSMPSSEPSRPPSERPSASPHPSQSPSTRPSVSSNPTIGAQPSLGPSASPSGPPSAFPTLSRVPSYVPSRESSGNPTNSPSDAPSQIPSAMPSETPSVMPSDSPTSLPTVLPSRVPSSFPTLTCHDKPDYRSPLNNLTCEDHAGTRCVAWRILNLNTEQLGDLINSCPETCDIPCGAFNQFSVSVSYHLSGIPGLLDPGPKAHLEKFSLDFLQDDVKDGLDSVELTSQSFVAAPTRQLRKLETGQTLKLSFTFEGFSIGLTTDEVTDLLVTGIGSDAFTSQLRGSGDPFFLTALASSASEVDAMLDSSEVDDDGKKGPSTATVVVSTLVSVSVFTFAIGALIYQNRSGKWVPQLKLPSLGDARMDQESPRTPSNWTTNPAGSLLSFDDSATQTAANSAGGLLRLMASLSLSRSKGSTEDDSSTPNSATIQPPPKVIVSPMSEESTAESVMEEHPLANIIPPMIVIDNIDDEVVEIASTDWGVVKHIERQVVPSKRVEASSELLAALNDSRMHRTSNSFAGMMLYNNQALDLNISGWAKADESRALSPLGIDMDSDDDDDDDDDESDDHTSVASTPVRLPSPTSPVSLRRSVSSSALESVGRHEARDPLFSLTVLDLPSSAVPTPRFYADGPNDDGWSLTSGADDNEASVSLTFDPLPSMNGRTIPSNSRMVYSVLSPLQVASVQPCTPDNRSENESRRSDRLSHSPIEGGRLKQSLWSLSPITRALKDNTTRTLRRPSVPIRADFGFTKKRPSAGEVLDHSEDAGQTAFTGGHHSQMSLDKIDHSKTFRCEFEAPRKGQLGLVIEANKATGPIVHAVKDYSPLFGLVKKGDKIVEVDGKKTIRSTLTEITRLLAVRPGRRGSNLRIVVERSKEQQAQHAVLATADKRHSRDSSHGSSSVGSSRFIEDVDAVGERNAFYSDSEQGGLYSLG